MYRLGRARVATSANGNEAGFTIIEVLFFLAISGALVVALLATVGFGISRQRFTDTVLTTQAYFQSQYDETLNVINDRGTGACGTGSNGTTDGGSTTTNRGASNCVVLGRAIGVAAGTTTITSYTVLGQEPSAAAANGVSGAALLALYKPGIDASSAQTYSIPWGATLTKARVGGSAATVSRILLLRSPDSGLVLTFGDSASGAITSALTNGSQTYNVCLRSADITSAISAVQLSPIAGAEGVTTKPDLSGADLGNLC